MAMGNVLGKIMGFLVIIITLALGPTIYTSNTTNVVSANLTNLIGMTAISGFGAFLIIFGLLVSGGIFAIAGLRNQLSNAGMKDLLAVIGSTIVVVVMLAMMGQVITNVNTLIAAAIAAGDTIGTTGFGIVPIVVYVGIIAAAGWVQVHEYRKLRKGGRRSYVGAYA